MKGECSCGSVHYEISNNPLFVHACYCTNCQRQSGSACALNAMIESHYLKQHSGSIETVVMATGSGMGQTIYRCTQCKVALWSTYAALGEDFSFIRVGSLENPSACPPDINIFTKSKASWVPIMQSIPSVEEYYDAEAMWPKAALERMKSVINSRT